MINAPTPVNPDSHVFVSFPRTGTHWVNCLCEFYFQRPRAFNSGELLGREPITLLDESAKSRDSRWYSTHDFGCVLSHDPKLTVYIYRDPVDVLYSNICIRDKRIKANGGFGVNVDLAVPGIGRFYRDHLLRYLVERPARTLVRYERFREDFPAICRHFGEQVDEVKADAAFAAVTKASVVCKATGGVSQYFHVGLMSEAYAADRAKFRERFSSAIYSSVIVPALVPFFDHIIEAAGR